MKIHTLLVLGFLVIGCKEKAKQKTPPVENSGSAQPGAAAAKGDRASKLSPRKQKAVAVRDRAEALLSDWTTAQKKLDFASYIALYDSRTFRGVKRTNDGKTRDYDFAGWTVDRKRMFDKKFEIATELLSVRSWLDHGSKLKKNMVEIRFVQRWRNPRYADHGVKVLHAWNSKDDRLRITYEDLLNSEQGWERVATSGDVAAISAIADQAAALAAWRMLAPTGADYDAKLLSIPSDPDVRRPMARALLAGGNFECTEVVEYSECGDEYLEWDELKPSAGFDDPCLRRHLAEWALGELEAQDFAAVEEQLLAIVALPEPEEDLISSVAVAIVDAPESVRMSLYRHMKEEDVEVENLSEAALVELAVDLGVDAAAESLDEVRHMEQLIVLLKDNEEMEDETRFAIFERLKGLKAGAVVKAFADVAGSDDNCELAMDAAAELASRKNKRFLPHRTTDGSGDDDRALCMLMHMEDRVERHALLALWIPPGGVEVVETHEDEFDGYEDDDDDGIPNREDDDYNEDDGEDDTPVLETDVEAVEVMLRRVFEHEAAEDGGWDPDRAEFSLEGADDPNDGGQYIDRFEFHTWSGCPC